MALTIVQAAPVTVLVVTEPDPSREFLTALARSERHRPVGRVLSVAEAGEAVRRWTPDVLVVELSTFDRLKDLTRHAPSIRDTATVVLSTLPAEVSLVTSLAAGAAGYVGSPAEPDVLEQAVSAVADGGTYVDPRCARWLVDLAVHGRGTRPDSGLTLRQSQVLRLAGAGLTNREIADALAMSVETVKTHVREAMHRLGVHNRRDATARATRTEGRR